MSQHQPHSVWLCPEQEQGERLCDTIAELTHRSGTSVFAPHVTILGDLQGAPNATSAACRSVAQRGVFQTKVREVACTDEYYMALFLDLDVPSGLITLRSNLCRSMRKENTSFRPHLSLAYGHDASLKDPDLLASLGELWRGQELVLSELCVVASSSDLPIHQWKKLDCLPLNSCN